MQYYETEENKRRLTDRKAKAAARERLCRRRNRRILLWAGLIALLAVFYFAVGKTYIAAWLKGQAQAAKGEAQGVEKTTTTLFGREDLKEANKDFEKEVTPSTTPAGQ